MAFPSWISRLHLSSDKKVPSPGIYHFKQGDNENKNHIHLRIEDDGVGLLMVNAAQAYHLNPSAASMAFWSLSGNSEIGRCFRPSKKLSNPEENSTG